MDEEPARKRANLVWIRLEDEAQVTHPGLLNAVRADETGWTNQLNGDATFGFCRADIDMIALGSCSFGGANNHVCLLSIYSASVRR